MIIHALRLLPGKDLKKSLIAFATEQKLKAAFIITCVGSLEEAAIRMAGAGEVKQFSDKLEILSLSGTFSDRGGHFHICTSDKNGRVCGGHLMEGCMVYTTAEIVIGEAPGIEFRRAEDIETGFKELKITPLK
ncbi:MAG TPA: PPC domain-containing DNA-binding protein [Bacteroidia bacterium]|jgi:predicted DNA-binding protein with PD1-like motif|nr:PPC domain-containing DNA-binding protein [Bacteroidia bacterium]